MGEEREAFLYTPAVAVSREGSLRQTKLEPMRGVEWFCTQILREVTNEVVEQAGLLEGVAEWEEWEAKDVQPRGDREERELWRMLDELDKLEARVCKAKKKKEAAKVTKARAKMGVSSNQRSIKEILAVRERGCPVRVAQLVSKDMTKSKTEGGRCVAAQTGSKSNIVHVSSLAPVPVSEAQSGCGEI